MIKTFKAKCKLFVCVTYWLLLVKLAVFSSYLVVTSGYLIATTGYFWLLLVTSGSSF